MLGGLLWSVFQHVSDIIRQFVGSYTPETYVNIILPVHVGNLLQKSVLLRDYTDCTSSKGKIVSPAREWIQSLSSCSSSSQCVGCVAHKLHPQAGPFVDVLLASELTIHLQQLPSLLPLYRLPQ